ncbi:unnamed protein product, partial [Strongylus vulgaris]
MSTNADRTPLQLSQSAVEVCIEETISCVGAILLAEVCLPLHVFDNAELSVIVQPKKKLFMEMSRVSRSGARQNAFGAVVGNSVVDHSFTLPSKPALFSPHLERKLGDSVGADSLTSQPNTSSTAKVKPVKRKLSGDSDTTNLAVQEGEPPSSSRTSRKSARVILNSADISIRESYSYAVEGDHVVKRFIPSARISQDFAQPGSKSSSSREAFSRIESSKSQASTSFVQDMSREKFTCTEPKKKTLANTSTEELFKKPVKEVPSLLNSFYKNEEPSTSKSRSRRSVTTSSARHPAPKISTAQAIIDAWRASSFEVLPQDSFISPTKRDTSATREMFRDLPKKSAGGSLSLGDIKVGLGRKPRSSLPLTKSTSRESAHEKIAVGVSKESSSKDYKMKEDGTSSSIKEKDREKLDKNSDQRHLEDSEMRTLRGNPTKPAGASLLEEVPLRGHSQKIKLEVGAAKVRKENSAKTTGISKQNVSASGSSNYVVTSGSSLNSSPERILRSATTEQDLRSNSGKTRTTKTLAIQSSKHRPNTHVQRPNASTKHSGPSVEQQQPMIAQRLQSPTRQSKTSAQPSKTSKQQFRAPLTGSRTSSARITREWSTPEETSVRVTRNAKGNAQHSASVSSGDVSSGPNLQSAVSGDKTITTSRKVVHKTEEPRR